MDKPLKLYLPESGTNFGVKGFNKSSRVESWSTMINASNSCELCSMELSCDECCSFCQAIEQHKSQFCMECLQENDDFVLDDMTLENFTMNYHINRSNGRYSMRSESKRQTDFFNRLRRFSWNSLFGSRKKINGSRLWNRIRSSTRLRGSKRYIQNKSRIFLPKGVDVDRKKNLYDEHYLKMPGMGSMPKINYYHEMDNEKKTDMDSKEFLRNNEMRMNHKLASMAKSNPVLEQKGRKLPEEHRKNIALSKALLTTDLDHDDQWTNDLPKNVDLIKPFFISHPGKLSNKHQDYQIDTKVVELGLNGISISSDSGLYSIKSYSH